MTNRSRNSLPWLLSIAVHAGVVGVALIPWSSERLGMPVDSTLNIEVRFNLRSVLLNSNSGWRVSDPLPPSAALPLTEGENKALMLRA